MKGPRLTIVPVTWREACAFVDGHHRHHAPPNGHRYSQGVVTTEDGILRGVVITSHPVARHLMDGRTLEVIRSATDGTMNANSCLYGAAWQAAKALGWGRLLTYTQEGESGASLRAAGWRVIGERPARGGWDCPSRPRLDKGTCGVARTLWEAS